MPPPDSEPRLFELWHYGTKRCRMTPRDGQPPFTVVIHDGERQVLERTFGHHDEAVSWAVEELRNTTAYRDI